MVHAVDHGTRPQEEECFEERVCHHVEDGCDECTGADGEEHEAELRDRRVREHSLDVVLSDCDRGGKECRGRANRSDRVGYPPVRLDEHRPDSCHEEDTGSHHRCRVDERRHRCRAFHRVGQPEVERKLRTLAARTDEEKHRDGGDRSFGDGSFVSRFVDGAVRHRANCGERDEHRGHHSPVTDAIGDEGFLTGNRRTVAGMPERDKEVRTRPHALPAEEGDEQVLPEHQHEHREDEQIEIEEELRELGVAVHVSHRIEVDERADARDEECHSDAQRVGEERQVNLQRSDRDPLK